MLSGPPARFPQAAGGRNGRQPLVHHPYVNPMPGAMDLIQQTDRFVPDFRRGRSFPTRERSGQADHNLDRLVFGDQGQQIGKLACSGCNPADSEGQQPVAVASRDPDPGVAPVKTEPDTGPERRFLLSSTRRTGQDCTRWPMACSTADRAAGTWLESVPPP